MPILLISLVHGVVVKSLVSFSPGGATKVFLLQNLESEEVKEFEKWREGFISGTF